jgi:integrase
MSFRMVTPRRSRSGSITVRKGIPRDVRAEYKRLYGVSSEVKLIVPAGTPAHEAKIIASDFLADAETRIAAIRAAQKGEGQSLTQRQAFALAGEWYVWYVGRHEENPGTPEHWRTMWDVLILELENHASPEIHERPWENLEWTRDPEVRAGIRPVIADEAKTAQFLASKGVVLTNDAQALFLDCVLDEFMAAILRLERLAGGDYKPDDRPSHFPKFDGRPVRQAATVTPWTLFDAWVNAAKRSDSTVNRWRAVFLDLEKRFANAGDITEDGAREWARKLVSPKRTPRTVNDVWITAAHTVFAWAVEERLIGANPFETVRVTEPKKVQLRETKAFTQEEAATILRASSAIGEPRSTLEGAIRWVPWLCAYSGARAGEITQLRGADIQKRGEIHVMLITPAAGTVKTKKARAVPIHQHLIEQGFLEFAKSRGDGPLFYDPVEENSPSDPLNPRRSPAVVVRQKVAAWVRDLGIADNELSPTHAWRHTFKQIADRAGISERMSDHITGHSHKSEGAKYGAPTPQDMAAALGKFPRYDLAFGQENGGQNRGK